MDIIWALLKQTIKKGPWGLLWSRRPEARKELCALGHGVVEVQRAGEVEEGGESSKAEGHREEERES